MAHQQPYYIQLCGNVQAVVDMLIRQGQLDARKIFIMGSVVDSTQPIKTRKWCRQPRPLEVRFWEKVNKDGPIVRSELGRCWIWIGSTRGIGYGQIMTDQLTASGKKFIDQAHRVSWRLAYDTSPDGLFVCHKCDNPPCVNPYHLELGNNQKNINDAVARGLKSQGAGCSFSMLTRDEVLATHHLRDMQMTQTAIGRALGISQQQVHEILSGRSYKDVGLPAQRGIRFVHHKLTEDQVRTIRSYSRAVSNKKLADMFGVVPSAIHNIRVGATWKHIL